MRYLSIQSLLDHASDKAHLPLGEEYSIAS
jgi:hypothetical protein